MTSDGRYWVQKNDNYELFLKDIRRESQNYPGWLSYFAPHKNYEMHYERDCFDNEQISFWNVNNLNIDLDLNKALNKRASIPVDKLAHKWSQKDILHFLNRVISDGKRVRARGDNKGRNIPLRNYPSGGAEYPIIPYLIFNKDIGEFKKNHSYKVHGDLGLITRVENTKDNLSFKNCFAVGNFNKKLSNQMNKLSFAIVFAMNLKWSFPKYRSFSEKLAYIEAGHIAENVQLVAAAMDKGSICSGGVLNDKCKEMLGINDDNIFVIYGVFVG